MVKEESIKKNYIYNTLFQVLLLIIPLITTPYVSRVLGADNIGKFSFFSSLASYFTIFAIFGSRTYGQRYISFYRDSRKELSIYFWNIFVFRTVMSIAMSVLYIFFLNISGYENLISLIFALNIIDVAFDITWFFQGIEKFKQIVIRNIIIRIISTISIFILVRSKDDLWIYTLIICLVALLGNVVMWPSILKIIDKPSKIAPFFNFKQMFLLFLPTISTQVYMVLDKSMIGFITGSDYANGCYEQAEKIARMSLTIVTSVAVVVLPRIGNLYKKGQLDIAKVYLYKSYRFVWLLSIPIAFGLIGISSLFTPVFFGAGYDDIVGLLQIFSFLVIFVSASYVTGLSYLIPTEQQNIYTIAVTLTAFINFIMNIILIQKYGAFGAAISSVFAEGLGCVIQIAYCCIKRQLEMSLIFKSFWNYFVCGLIMLGFIIFLKGYLPESSVSLILLIPVAATVYFLSIISFGDDFVLENMRMLLKKIRP